MAEQLSETPAFAPADPVLKREPSNFELAHNETARFAEAQETEARAVETLGDVQEAP